MKEHEAIKFKAEAGMEPCWLVWEAAASRAEARLMRGNVKNEILRKELHP